MFHCTVHPYKRDQWWPTCLGFDVEASTAYEAKSKARVLAMKSGMGEPKKIVATKVGE